MDNHVAGTSYSRADPKSGFGMGWPVRLGKSAGIGVAGKRRTGMLGQERKGLQRAVVERRKTQVQERTGESGVPAQESFGELSCLLDMVFITMK